MNRRNTTSFFRHGLPSGQRWPLIASVPAALLTLLFVALPFVASFVNSLAPEGYFDAAAYRALLDSAFRVVLQHTLQFAVCLTLGCLVLGTPAAYALLRCSTKWRRLLLFAINLSFFAGILVRSYAWLAILGRFGLLNWLFRLAGLAHPFKLAYTFPAMLVACIQIELPVFILPLYGVMQRVDRRIVQAAESLGADPLTAWITIFLPQIVPGLAVSTALVFLTGLGFYAAPTLLGPPNTYLLSQELDVQLNTLGDEAGAGARIVVMFALIVLSSAIFALLYRWATRRGRSSGVLRFPPLAERLARCLSPWRWLPAGFCTAVVIVLLLAPMLMLPVLAFNGGDFMGFPPHTLSLRWFHLYFMDDDLRSSTWFSLQFSLLAAALAALAGAAAALANRHLAPLWRWPFALLACAPLVVSSITITAALFIVSLRLPWIEPSWLFIAVYSVLGLPYSYLLVGAANARLDPRLAQAAESLGASPWTTMRTITLPLLAPSFASAFVFAFLLAFDDISAGLFLSTAEHMPLAVRLWESLKFSITPMPAVIAMLGFSVGLTIYAVVKLLPRLRTLCRRMYVAN